MMKRALILVFILLISLSGCHANTPEVPASVTTEPSPAATKGDLPLAELTDYELLRIMAEEKVCQTWLTCSYIGESPLSTLMEFSPEFTELLSRRSAAQSIETYISSLEEEFPGCCLSELEIYLQEIEEYAD